MSEQAGKQNRKNSILCLMEESNYPVGALYLAEKMNAASATVGRALSELEQAGLIYKVGVRGRMLTEKGKQYLEEYRKNSLRQEFVQDLIVSHPLLGDRPAGRAAIIDIMNLRLLLEPYAAAESCKNVTEEQVKQLEQSVLEYKLQIAKGSDGDEPGMRMHLLLAEFSGNTVLKSLVFLLLDQTHAHVIFSRAVDKAQVLDKQAAEHEAIVAAVRQRDGRLAAKLMRQHIAFSLDYLKKMP